MSDHIRIVTSAPGKNRRLWHTEESVTDWSSFCSWLTGGGDETGGKYARPYTPVTLAESPGRRLNANLATRHLITLDADTAGQDYLTRLSEAIAYTSISHTTASHTEAEPRWRTVIPVSRPMTPQESKTVALWLVGHIGAERFDVQMSTSPAAVAYAPAWPDVSWSKADGRVLDVDDVLLVAEPADWSPTSSQGDPQTVHEFLADHEDGIARGACQYGRAALDGVVADLEAIDEGSGVHPGIYAAACRYVEMVRAGCWDVDADLERLSETAVALRTEPRPNEFSEALTSALARGCEPDNGCTQHLDAAADFAGLERLGQGEDVEPGDAARVMARPDLYFTQKGKLLPQTAAAGVRSFLPVGVDERAKTLLGYRGGLWHDAEDLVRGMLTTMFGEYWTPANRAAVLELLRESPDLPRLDRGRLPHPGLVNLPNGMLRWSDGQLLDHDERHLSGVQFNVSWDPAAECPQFERYLADVLDPDVVESGFIWEVLGYLLINGNPLHKAVYLYGPQGRNGKSTLLRVLEGIVGPRNYSSVDLFSLTDDKFSASELYGRLLNIAGDVDPKWLENTAVIKKATGGDPISAQRKYGHPFSFTPWAVSVFSGNDLFGSADTSQGWLDRWIVVKFPHSFYGREDPHLADRLRSEDELRGVLRYAMAGAARLMERGRFDPPASVQAAHAEMALAGDSVRQWVTDHCVMERGARTPRPELWRHYEMTCEGALIGKYKFFRRLEQLDTVGTNASNGVRYFEGIRPLAP